MSKTVVTTAADSGFRAAPALKRAAMTSASSRHRRVAGPVRPENHVIVLFAATGDLARRKLLPGLFQPEARDQGSLTAAGVMPDRYRIIGSSRRSRTDEQFREHARQAIAEFGSTEPAGAALEAFQSRLSFVSADPFHTFPLVEAVARAEQQIGGAPGRLFHLAVPPAAFEPTVTMLGGRTGRLAGTQVSGAAVYPSSTAPDDPGVGSLPTTAAAVVGNTGKRRTEMGKIVISENVSLDGLGPATASSSGSARSRERLPVFCSTRRWAPRPCCWAGAATSSSPRDGHPGTASTQTD